MINLKHSFLALTSLFLLGTVSMAYGMEEEGDNHNPKSIHVNPIKDKDFGELNLNKLYKLTPEELDNEIKNEDKITLLLEKKEKNKFLCFGINENSQNNEIFFNRKRKSIETNNTNQKKPSIEIQKKSSPTKDNGEKEFEQGKKAFYQGDKQKAREQYQLSAKKGHLFAKYYLGKIYLFGDGVAENEEEGIKWITEAAQNGLKNAQFQLGQQYRIGKGVNEDRNEAIRWYTLAANRGHTKATQQLEAMKNNEIEENTIINTTIERIEENEESQAIIQSNASQFNIDPNPKRKENENK
jgi:hypothetical protein